ncbi:TPA: NAD(P)/FAD-dependent oxidoreductase, partial [Candidatus Bathyarchaeota archaeon]|nr:NAD(P)/FAD-dependent oxidoreductase [Candidatus Bathyarchaeota archaeon]
GGERFQKGYIIDKPKFLSELAERARSKGAEIKLGARVTDAWRDESLIKLTVKEGTKVEEVAGKVVLGCDGYSSLIAKKFFDTSKVEYTSCVQYTLVNCELEDEHLLRFYLGSSVAPLGYLWIFPKGDGVANVGVGVRKGSPKPYLDKFIKEHPSMFRNVKPVKFGGAPVVTSGQLPKVTGDNLMLCGEAAGQVIPFTGAGIHTGIVAGKIAGAVAAEAVKSGNVTEKALLPYKNEFDEIFGANIKRSLKAMKVFEELPDEDFNNLANLLSGEDIIDLANGLNVERVAKKLLSHPILAVKVAKALLT